MTPAATLPYAVRRREAAAIGVWLFLATVAMLFAAFVSAYLVRRTGADWVPVTLPVGLWWNTAVVVASSVTLERAWPLPAGSRRRGWLLATLALGVLFLCGQAAAWQTLRAAGFLLPSNPHASFIYVLTGVHAVHLLAALVLMGTVVTRSWRRAWDAPALTNAARSFWHALTAIWAVLLVVLTTF